MYHLRLSSIPPIEQRISEQATLICDVKSIIIRHYHTGIWEGARRKFIVS